MYPIALVISLFTFLHTRLLILDEPTVGVDPVLRAKLWKHLLKLVQTDKVTILITTHYIEEARQVNVMIVY